MKTLKVKIHLGVKRKTVVGYLPFKFYGEAFAVTETCGERLFSGKWTCTHIKTGFAVPRTYSNIKRKVPKLARQVMESRGKTKVLSVINDAKQLTK